MFRKFSGSQQAKRRWATSFAWLVICTFSYGSDLAAQQQVRTPWNITVVAPARGIGDLVAALHIEGIGPEGALRDIAKKANVVIGVTAVQSEAVQKIAFDFPGGTVANLLDMFVTQAPEHAWKADGNNIIHVSTAGARVSLADVPINYPGAKDQTRRQIWFDLHRSPEYRNWMRTNKCRSGDEFHAKNFIRQRGAPHTITVPAGPMTLAQLLDEVAVKSGMNYWAISQSVQESDCQVAITVW
jgi:hypothetical protein